MSVRIKPALEKLAPWRAERRVPDHPVLLRRTYVARAEPQADRVVRFTISTGQVDRYNDVIEPGGWEFDDWLRNPVVLWGHRSWDLPIGKGLLAEVQGDSVVSDARFATAEEYPFADQVYRLVQGGYLRAASVGFEPLEWTFDEARGGYNITRAALWEWSVVTIPANTGAVRHEHAARKNWRKAMIEDLGQRYPLDDATRDALRSARTPGAAVTLAVAALTRAPIDPWPADADVRQLIAEQVRSLVQQRVLAAAGKLS